MKILTHFVRTALSVSLFSILQTTFANEAVLPTILVNSNDDPDIVKTTESFKTHQTLFKTARSVSVVSKKQIEQKQAMNLTDALNGVSGVISAPLGRRGADDFIIRGQLASDAIYIDGLRQAQASDSPVDITGLERVEVIKGPSSMDFGLSAPGGLVNLVTKRAIQDNFNTVELRYGSQDLRQIIFDTNHTLNESSKAAWRLNTSYSDQNDSTDNVYFKSFYISPTYTFDLGDQTDLSVIASYSHKEYMRQQGIPVYGSLLTNSYGQLNRSLFIGEPDQDPYISDVYRVGYNFAHRFNEGWEFKQNFALQKTRLDGQVIFANSSSLNSQTIKRSGRDQLYKDLNFSVDNNLSKTFDMGATHHHVMVGVDAIHDTRDIWNYTCTVAGNFNIYRPNYLGNDWCSKKTLRSDSVKTTLKIVGTYLKDRIDLTENLNLDLGVRHDWATVSALSHYDQSDNSKNSHAFSGNIGVLYDIHHIISPYMSYSTSFLPVTDVDENGKIFEPEKANQYEVGFKIQSPSQRIQASLAWFDLTRFNVVSSDADGVNYQTGKQNSKGVETEIVAKIRPNWLVSANYTYTPTAKIVNDEITSYIGKRLNNVSKQAFNFSTRYEFLGEMLSGWYIGAGVRAESEKTSYKYAYTVPGYALWDAEVGYNTTRWQASLNAKNIFNKEYYAGGVNSNIVALGDDRQVNFNFRYRF